MITSVDAGASAARIASKLVAKGRPGAHEAALALVEQLIGHPAEPTLGPDHAFGGSSCGDVVIERTTRSGASRTPMASA